MDAAVAAARERLSRATPLKMDCGRVCGARCCRPLDGEETGMLLFPGEAEAYAGLEGWTVRPAARGGRSSSVPVPVTGIGGRFPAGFFRSCP